ncbi:MAG: fatty acid cis/trans isomerase [Bdellovibrio sp.]
MKKWRAKAFLSLMAVFTIASCVSLFNKSTDNITERTISSYTDGSSTQYVSEKMISDSHDRYLNKIQPIFNNRCIACHSCFNSPCQLNLTSFTGVDRGAIQDDIYDFRDIGNKTPTRLGIDVPQAYDWFTATKLWREKIYVGSDGKKGFFPVVERDSTNPEERLNKSVLYQMLKLKIDNPHQSDKPFMAEQSRSCPRNPESGLLANNDLEEFKQNMNWAGMPYGFPQLSENEMKEIKDWIIHGSYPPTDSMVKQMERPSKPQTITKWETFFNGQDQASADPRRTLTSRYIYEHLFLAHVYFDDMPGEFFRLIRAYCPNDGTKCYELPTQRPTDDPKTSRFYNNKTAGKILYKLQKVTNTLVHKSHIPFELNDTKLNKWENIFVNQISRNLRALPRYGDEAGGNPFITFKDIPAKSRYQFLLDDSYFFVMSFIKGPVCRGSGALSVIDDHFWVFFLKPSSDVTIEHPAFFLDAGEKLAVPAFDGNKWKLLPTRRFQARMKKKEYMDKYMTEGLGLTDVWDGDGTNPNAVLTIYRHEDSASVSRGAIGESPKTMWLLDYPIFEDIYYNLVGTYDVFAPIVHSVKSRLHMDASRFNGQDMFLGLVPLEKRMVVRAQFTRDSQLTPKVPTCKLLSGELCGFASKSAGTVRDTVYPYAGPKLETRLKVTSIHNVQDEVANQILAFLPEAVTKRTKDTINNRPDESRESIESFKKRDNITIKDTENIFATIAGKRNLFASELPELSYVQVVDPEGLQIRWYSMIHNRERYNVAFFEEIAPEKERLWPEKDSVNFVKGFIGSYANAIFSVPVKRLPEFIDDIQNLKSGTTNLKEFYKKFLVSRHNPEFWHYYDNMIYYAKQEGATAQSDKYEGSVIDLNRYINDQGF